ncbi:MAG: hypothetical protein R3B70_29675 [Polyangiaceae bacterium]
MSRKHLLSFGLLAFLAGCSTSTEAIDGGDNTPRGSVGVVQGGAQDIALFRSLVEEGKVPTPETLEPVGFFAEHAIDLPDADCGKDICIHPFLAVAPRFDGSNWTMAFVAMNTAVDPSELPRPPVHLAIAVERSQFANVNAASLEAGVQALAGALRPEDRVSLVSFGYGVKRTVLMAEPGSTELADGLAEVLSVAPAGEEVGLFDGIASAATAFEDGDAAGFAGEHRVLLITSGHATTGITDPEHILGLGEAMVADGSAFGVLGVGSEFDVKIPSELGSMGAGTYAYAMNGQDLSYLLEEEGKTTLFPLATKFNLELSPSAGYKVGRIYGTRRARATNDGAEVAMPALFIGQREGSADVGGSRRGGGGGLFVELLFDEESASGIGNDAPAFQVKADWTSAATEAAQGLDLTMLNSLPPGENPDDMWWQLSDGGSGKPYMMLNMYLALKASLDFFQAGDCARSLGVIDMMQTPVSAWLGEFSDLDIEDDNNLMMMLRQNIKNACEDAQSSTVPIEPTNFNGGCCYS